MYYSFGDIYRFPSLRLQMKKQTSLETVFLVAMVVAHTRTNSLFRVKGATLLPDQRWPTTYLKKSYPQHPTNVNSREPKSLLSQMLRYCHTFAAKLSFGIVSFGGKSKFFNFSVSTVQVDAVQVPPHRWATPDKTFPLEQLPHLLQSTGSSLTFSCG